MSREYVKRLLKLESKAREQYDKENSNRDKSKPYTILDWTTEELKVLWFKRDVIQEIIEKDDKTDWVFKREEYLSAAIAKMETEDLRKLLLVGETLIIDDIPDNRDALEGDA